jgi:ATP-dependent DNA helicase RecQ
MEAIKNYAEQTHRCRMQIIQEYFDEETYQTCGLCDVCIEKRRKENLTVLKDYEQQVMYLLNKKPMTVEELETSVDPAEKELFIDVVREMVDANQIAYDEFWVLRVVK